MKKMLRASVAFFTLSAALFLGSPVQAVTDADILNDQMTVEDVVSNGLGPRVQKIQPTERPQQK